MTRDRSDAREVVYEPVGAAPRRITYEPRDDGWWDRIEEEHNGCRWRLVGVEAVTRVAIDAPAEVVDGG